MPTLTDTLSYTFDSQFRAVQVHKDEVDFVRAMYAKLS